MVVSRTLTIDSVMVPLVVSSKPKGMGRAIGKRIVGGNGWYSVHMFVVDNDIAHLECGSSKNHLGMSLVLAFIMQTNIFAVATEVYWSTWTLDHCWCGQGGTPVWSQCWCWWMYSSEARILGGAVCWVWSWRNLQRGCGKNNDALHRSESLAKDFAFSGGVLDIAVEGHDEVRGGFHMCRGQSAPRGRGSWCIWPLKFTHETSTWPLILIGLMLGKRCIVVY